MNKSQRIQNTLVILAHPERRSFNGQLADRCVATLRRDGYTASIADLYGEGFDPVEESGHYITRRDPGIFVPMSEQRYSSRQGQLPQGIAAELTRLRAADLVIFQFPMWWYGPPAILKGWFDRVMVCGETYSSTKRYDRGVFRGRDALISVTTGSPESTFQSGRDGEIEYYLWPIHFTLHYLGFTVWPPHVSYGIHGDSRHQESSDAFRRLVAAQDSLAAYLVRILNRTEAAPMRFNGWGDWDEQGKLLPDAQDKFPFRRSGDFGLKHQ